MAIIVVCECEAAYEQIEIVIEDRVENSVDCRVCGHELKSWNGNKVLSFDLIKNPTG